MVLQNHLQAAKSSKRPSLDKRTPALTIQGVGLDKDSRCMHYHTKNDVVALACAQCHQHFACYQCHDAIMTHKFAPADPTAQSVMCGVCHQTMDYQAYSQNECPNCHHAFNPKCARHQDIYFES